MALGLNDTRPKTRGGNQSGNFGATQMINSQYQNFGVNNAGINNHPPQTR